MNYTLKSSYLGKLQVTAEVPRSDLESPRLLQACSDKLGPDLGRCGGPGLKFPGRFVDPQSGEALPVNPLLWPNGQAIEVGCGPWRHRGPRLRALAYITARLSPVSETVRPWLEAEEVCGRMLGEEVAWQYVPLAGLPESRPWWETVDWQATFDLRGVNAALLLKLDRAEWRLGPALSGDPIGFTAVWLAGNSRLRLDWNPDRLIDGCRLTAPGESVLYETVAEALLAVGLEAIGEGSVLEQARDSSGSLSTAVQGLLRRALRDTVAVTRRAGVSREAMLLPV